MPMKLVYPRKLQLSVAAAGAFSLLAVGTAFVSFRQAVRSSHTIQLEKAADLVACHKAAHLLERKLAKSRTFILTGDETFAEEMEDARAEMLATLGQLNATTQLQEGQDILQAIQRLETRHHEVLRKAVAKRRRGAPTNEVGRILIEDLKPLRDDLDEQMKRLIAWKDSRLSVAEQEAASTMRFAQKISLSAGATTLMAFLVVVALVRRLAIAQMEIERGLRRSNAELDSLVAGRTKELSNLNRELESFSYSVAHDLRTPLRAITNYSDIALTQLQNPADQSLKERIERIRAAGLRMSQVIDSLLSLSRLTRRPLDMKELDLAQIASQVSATIAQANPERQVAVKIAEDLHETGDEGLLRAALHNLFDNAWKFTSVQSHAVVEFGRTIVDGASAYFVRDNGVGFDPAFTAKLFIPFERLHSINQFPGTGIGLATVERVVQRHGGSVWAEGRINGGATIFFTLHRRLPSRERAPAPARTDA